MECSASYVAISPAELKILTGPGVYEFRYGNDEVLYVGATTHGLARPFSRTHTMNFLLDLDGVHLTFIPTPTQKDAFELEETCIRVLKPYYNERFGRDANRRAKTRERALQPKRSRRRKLLSETTIAQLRAHYPHFTQAYLLSK